MSFQNQISLNTKGHGDMKDITEQVAGVVNSSGIKTGIVRNSTAVCSACQRIIAAFCRRFADRL